MSITKQLDGIVCETQWNKTKPKILFILKETNRELEEGDLRSFIREHGLCYPMWRNIGKWAYYLINTRRKLSYEKIGRKQIEEGLLSCAVINLKKTGGKSTTNMNALWERVKTDDNGTIKRQINQINPSIVVCGYTLSPQKFKEILNITLRRPTDKKRCDKKRYWYEYANNKNEITWFLDFWHPARKQGRKAVKYYKRLCAAYKIYQRLIK